MHGVVAPELLAYIINYDRNEVFSQGDIEDGQADLRVEYGGS